MNFVKDNIVQTASDLKNQQLKNNLSYQDKICYGPLNMECMRNGL